MERFLAVTFIFTSQDSGKCDTQAKLEAAILSRLLRRLVSISESAKPGIFPSLSGAKVWILTQRQLWELAQKGAAIAGSEDQPVNLARGCHYTQDLPARQ